MSLYKTVSATLLLLSFLFASAQDTPEKTGTAATADDQNNGTPETQKIYKPNASSDINLKYK